VLGMPRREHRGKRSNCREKYEGLNWVGVVTNSRFDVVSFDSAVLLLEEVADIAQRIKVSGFQVDIKNKAALLPYLAI